MGVRRTLRAVSILVVAGLAGCGSRASVSRDLRPVRHRQTLPTPTLSQQVRRAQRAGPGTLEYCPLHTGRAAARYSLTVPGGGTGDGWCETRAQRLSQLDRITFSEHWDASHFGAGTGTETLVYELARVTPALATPVPHLVAQHGLPPP